MRQNRAARQSNEEFITEMYHNTCAKQFCQQWPNMPVPPKCASPPASTCLLCQLTRVDHLHENFLFSSARSRVTLWSKIESIARILLIKVTMRDFRFLASFLITARSVEDETRNGHRNARRNPNRKHEITDLCLF